MRFIFTVLILCFSVYFVTPSSEHHHNEHKNYKEKHHHERNHHPSGRHHRDHHQAHVRHHHQGSHFVSHYRANENRKHCSWVCHAEPANPSNIGLEVIFNSSASIFAIVNKYSGVALLFDTQVNFIALFNGQSGVTFVTNMQTNKGYRLPQTQDISWSSTNLSFLDYLRKVHGEDLLKIVQEKGESVDINKLSEAHKKEIEEELKSLGVYLSIKEFSQLCGNFFANLKLIFPALSPAEGVFDLPINLTWFLKIASFFVNFLKTEGFDLSSIKIDTKDIFTGSSGLQFFVNLLSQLGKQVNITKIISSFFNSREKTIALLSDLSGGSHDGLDGLVTILVNILKLLSGPQVGSVNELISSIVKYNSTDQDELALNNVFKQFLEILKSQDKRFPNSEGISKGIEFVQSLLSNNLVLHNINVGDFIKLFLSPHPGDKFKSTVRLLSILLPQNGIPSLIGFFKDILNGTSNPSILTNFIPGLDLSRFAGGSNILNNVLHGQNLTQLFSSGGNASQILSNIPIFGTITSQISSALGGHNLEEFLNPGHLQDIFKGFIPPGNFFGALTNATQFGDGFGGIVNSIQDSLGSFFGLGNNLFKPQGAGNASIHEEGHVSISAETPAVTDESKSTDALTTVSDSANQDTQTTLNGQENEITSGKDTASSPAKSSSSSGQLLGGIANIFGLRGSIGGGFNLNIEEKARPKKRYHGHH